MVNVYKISGRICLIIITVFSIFAHAKDTNYYLSHLDEANQKRSICEKLIESYAAAGNEEKLVAVISDQECTAAVKAVKKAASEKRMKKIRAQHEAERRKEALVKAENERKLAGLTLEYNKLSLMERLSSPALEAWRDKCDENPLCSEDVLGYAIYDEAVARFNEDPLVLKKEYQYCGQLYQQPQLANLIDAKPMSFSEDSKGVNECQAAYDVLAAKQTLKLMQLSIEERVNEAITCYDENNYNTCHDAVYEANTQIYDRLVDQFESGESDITVQREECKAIKDNYDGTSFRDFVSKLRRTGECRAVRYF